MATFQLEWKDFLEVFEKLRPRELVNPLIFYYEKNKEIYIYWPHQNFVFSSKIPKSQIPDLQAFKAEYLQNSFQLTDEY